MEKEIKVCDSSASLASSDTDSDLNDASKRSVYSKIVRIVKDNFILFATVIAVISGIGLAFALRKYTNLKPPEKAYFAFPGQVFLRMLKFLLLPLISSSLIIGIAGLGSGNAGRIAGRAMLYFFLTTISAVILGLILVTTIKPGLRNKKDTSKPLKDPLQNQKISTIDTILDLIRYN